MLPSLRPEAASYSSQLSTHRAALPHTLDFPCMDRIMQTAGAGSLAPSSGRGSAGLLADDLETGIAQDQRSDEDTKKVLKRYSSILEFPPSAKSWTSDSLKVFQSSSSQGSSTSGQAKVPCPTKFVSGLVASFELFRRMLQASQTWGRLH